MCTSPVPRSGGAFAPLSHWDAPQPKLPTVLTRTINKSFSVVLFWALDGNPGTLPKVNRASGTMFGNVITRLSAGLSFQNSSNPKCDSGTVFVHCLTLSTDISPSVDTFSLNVCILLYHSTKNILSTSILNYGVFNLNSVKITQEKWKLVRTLIWFSSDDAGQSKHTHFTQPHVHCRTNGDMNLFWRENNTVVTFSHHVCWCVWVCVSLSHFLKEFEIILQHNYQ